VNVAAGPRDIYAALDGAFDVQEVTIREGKFPQYTTIAQLPPVLQIQVQRVQYDVTNKKTYKSEAHLRLRHTIYLDRYMDLPHTEMHEKRQQSWRLKECRQMLAARKNDLLQTQVRCSGDIG
jgi:ubiquitin carboxyl-terminal hydrolase 25/28